MNLKLNVILLCIFALCYAKDCTNVKRTNSKLLCYYSSLTDVDNCFCTHLILPPNIDLAIIKQLKQKLNDVKILLTVRDFNEDLVKTVLHNDIDGLELSLKKLSSKDDISEFINTVRTKLGNDLFLALSIPPNTEHLAKYYDLKSLTKSTDLFILQTAFLGASKNATFHPSRLSGLWDMQNTDSVVDLVTGMGAPLSRLVITAPVQAFQFTLQESTLTTPGSPALKLKTISRKELCEKMRNNKQESWTLERDQDQAGPYIFRGSEWIAFEDSTSMDIKAKYARVRGLAGLALKDVSHDIAVKNLRDSNSNNEESFCEDLLSSAHAGLSKQNRAPRQAVLRSLEREILDTPIAPHIGTVNVSPYRITRVVDVEGHVHSIRKDTRTEFECSRQGYFVHPHSCGRFYRCVKFDQLVDEFSVFEFDCPAGLVFDERVEVCVWPGNLPDGTPCHGSSEIAPVPKNRFACPSETGYYADPENCRWFFACLDHGKSGMTAYEFRCPFGLVFDEKRLLCEWPWLVPTCGSGYISGLQLDSYEFYGGTAKSSIILGAGSRSHLERVNLKPQVSILDSYDGLGSLGTVALGGYTGDINLLKENLNHNSGYAGYASGNLAHVVSTQGTGELVNTANANFGSANLHLTTGYAGSAGIHDLEGTLLSNSKQGAYGYYSNLDGKLSSQSAISSQFQNYGSVASASSDDQSKIGVIHFGTGLNDASYVQTHGSYGTLNAGSAYAAEVRNSYPGNPSLNSGSLLLDANLKSQELNGAKSSSSYVQYFDKSTGYDNSAQEVLVNADYSNQDLHLVNNGAKVDLGVTKTSLAVPIIQLEGQTHSGNLGYNYQYANEANYKLQPAVSYASATKSTYNSGLSLSEPIKLNNALNYIAVTPKTEVFKIEKYQDFTPAITKQSGYSTAYQYQAPAAQYEQKLVQPIATEIKTPTVQQVIPVSGIKQSGYSSSYHYQAPAVHVKQQEIVQPVLTQIQTAIPLERKQQTTGYSSSYHYQDHKAPSIQYENYQVQQPVVTAINTPVQPAQTVVPLVEVKQPVHLASYQYQAENVPTVLHYEEQKIKPIGIEYKYKATEEKLASYSNSYQHQAPSVHLQYQSVEQPQQIVTEIKTPIIQPETIVSIPQVKPQHSGYSHSYHYQAPSVQLQYEKVEQPQQIVTQIKTPIIQQDIVTPVAQVKQQENGYSHSYQYQAPSVQLQYQKSPQIITEIKTPIVQQETIVPATPIKKEQSGYSHSYHYHAPSIQLQYEKVEQPQQIVTEIKTPIIHQETIVPITPIKKEQSSYSHSYNYQAPSVQLQYNNVEQPQQIVTEVRTPIVQHETIVPITPIKKEQSSYSHSYHYQAPSVQLQYDKVEQPTQIFTEIKVPIAQQQIVLPEVKQQSGYSSSYNYQAPSVQYKEIKSAVIQQEVIPVAKSIEYTSHAYQSPVVYEQKAQPVVQLKQVQPIVETKYETPIVSSEAKQTSYSSTYHYQEPSVQYEPHKVQPIVQYEQKVQPIVTKIETPVAVPQTKQNSYSSVYHHQLAPTVETVQYEQKEQPIVQYEHVQPVVTKIETPVSAVKQTGYSSTYQYQQPTVQYEEKVVQPVVYEQNIHPVVTKIETPVLTSEVKQNGYQYQAPVVKFEQKVVQPVVPYAQKIQPIVKYEQNFVPGVYQTNYDAGKSHSQFYGVQHKEETVAVTPKYETVSVTPQYESQTHQYYDKRIHEVKIPIVQQPSAFVTPKYEVPVVQPQFLTPKVKTTYYNQHVHQPVVEQKVFVSSTAPPEYKSQFYGTNYNPISYEGQIPVVEDKIVPVKTYQTYTSAPVKQVVTKYDSREYLPPKPIVNTVYVSSTPKPQVYIQPKAQEVFVSTTPNYAVFQDYIQPKQTFEIKKKVVVIKTVTPKPEVVESYSYIAPQPVDTHIKQDYVYTAPKANVYVSTTPSYKYVQPEVNVEIRKPSPTVISQYEYVNPEYQNYESKLNLNLEQAFEIPKSSVEQHHTQKTFYSTLKPDPVEVLPVKNYQTQYIVSTPRPTFISTIAPVVKQTPTLRTKVVAINKYETYDNIKYVSPPKQIYISTPAPVVKTSKEEVSLPEFRYYDSRLDTNYKIKQEEPVQYYKGAEYYNEYDYIPTEKTKILSTIRPVVVRKKIASTTTPIPLEIYSEYSDDAQFDSQYIVEAKPTIATTYRPKIEKYIVSTTAAPENFYYEDKVLSTVRPVLKKKIVTTTKYYDDAYNSEYVITTSRPKTTSTLRPIVKKKKIVVTTTTTEAPEFDYEEYVVSSEKPKYESVKITPRPKVKGSKTVVRVNDFHPFLTTKLGAQCTCLSNTVKLRKGSKENKPIIVEDYEYELPETVPVTKLTSDGPAAYDDYNEPGVYVVGNSDIEDDYDYDVKKIVAVTKTPQIKSTTNAAQPAPMPIYTIRKKVTTARPEEVEITSVSNRYRSRTSTATTVEEVLIRKAVTPAIKRKGSKSKEDKIAEAVNEGLSLVKSAVKSAVKEAIDEESRKFDRYGPGGWRSRDETLQGSVDCKREGLFRHPTQCNKFYACHWDCKKERYTLHVFNCPVHLTFDTNQGACNWPSKGPACAGNTLLPNA